MAQSQISVVLSDDLRRRVETAALVGEQSVAQEVRLRLQRSFEREDSDAARPDIRELLGEVAMAVNLVEQVAKRQWHEDDETRSLLRHALDTIFARHGIVPRDDQGGMTTS
jgi:hypothetical protein